MKTTPLGDIFTQAQIDAAMTIWLMDRNQFHKRVIAEIVEPAMPQINEKTGQENDAGYMAYMLEAVFMRYS